jgi:serine/threonine protein kinase
MGELLLARASAPGGVQKLVAIKRVRPEYASDPTFVTMFLNEARLAATLDHPNVVRTYDLAEDDGNFFMVMEYLHGESLGRLLNAGGSAGEAIPLVHVLTIALGIAAGLHCAHERRGVDGRRLDIVHRDLSPGNVFITYEGGVKLLDFGIAKATSRTSITLGPMRKGKVSYMSPEQCVGADVDRRSDIFALGVVAWELCTRRRLFRGDNEFAIMNQITTVDAPSPRDHVPDLPLELCEIIARALRRDREERFQTAMAFHDAVETFAARAGLLPSTAALGRYLEECCGCREYPSVEPSDEFAHAEHATLTVPVATQPPRSRRMSSVLALTVGAVVGAVGVLLSSSDTAAVSPSPAPPDESSAISGATETKNESARQTAAATPPTEPNESTPTEPSSASQRVEDPDDARRDDAPGEPPVVKRRPARNRAPARDKTSPPAAKPEASKNAVRGLDGLLPRD